jgi:thioredoxin 1
MKRCPTCDRTFEDSFTFCLIDGSVLSAPFDLKATLTVPAPRQTEPPPTEVLPPEEEIEQETPPTVASPRPEPEPQAEVVSTIVAPAPAFKSPEQKVSLAQPARRSGRSLPLVLGVGALLVIGLILFLTSNRGSTTDNNISEADKEILESVFGAEGSSKPLPTESPTGKVIRVTEVNYEKEVANSRTPVLLTFSATWEAPEIQMDRVVEAAAKEYAGRVRVGEVDIDVDPNLAQKFGIISVPTLVVIKGGVEQERAYGKKSVEEVRRILDKYSQGR